MDLTANDLSCCFTDTSLCSADDDWQDCGSIAPAPTSALPPVLYHFYILRDTSSHADFDTRMRDAWVNRTRIMQVFREGLLTLKTSLCPPSMTFATKQEMDKFLEDSIDAFELSEAEAMINRWSFTKPGTVTVTDMRREHAEMTKTWEILVSHKRSLHYAMGLGVGGGVDMTPLMLSFGFESGGQGPIYTNFASLAHIWRAKGSNRQGESAHLM